MDAIPLRNPFSGLFGKNRQLRVEEVCEETSSNNIHEAGHIQDSDEAQVEACSEADGLDMYHEWIAGA